MRARTTSRIGRLGWFVLMLIGIGLVVALYSVKTRALQAKALVSNLEHTLEQKKASVRMLNAEIAHLENPERLRALSQEYLNLQPVEADRTLTLAEAVDRLPKKADEEGGEE